MPIPSHLPPANRFWSASRPFFFAPGAIFNTIESYNGRALNGLGTKFNQEQVADFIAAGGTFAVGSVFEPFSFSIPDNEFLFQRMLVPHKYWGEAAYMALPMLRNPVPTTR